MTEVAIRVIARFRPINKREMQESNKRGWAESDLRPYQLSDDMVSVSIDYGGRIPRTFTLDRFLGEETVQTEAFEAIALPAVMDCLRGINGCVFAYGQTGSGKTFSMFGPEVPIEQQEAMVELLGMIPQAAMIIFEYLRSDKAAEVAKFSVELSVLEIYVGNTLRDLLHPAKRGDKALKLRDGPRGVFVQGLKTVTVRTLSDVLEAIAVANKSRTTSSTNMNATSSRSHSVFTIKVKTELRTGTQRNATLNFCDLAGSEKIGKTGAVGKQMHEGNAINMSLTILGRVINALVTHRNPPFRESALTHVLKDSLQGNCKTTILVCVSPHKFNVTETVNTLQFAMRAKLIKNKVKVNKVLSRQELNKIIKELNQEIKKLKDKLGGKVIHTLDQQEVEKRNNARTLYVKFSWKDRTVEDLPHGMNHAKSQVMKAIQAVGTAENLKNLKINFGIRNEEKENDERRLVIMIMVHENEFYDHEQIEIARDKIHKGLKGMGDGIFVEADSDSVGCLSAGEKSLLDAETQKIMMNDLKELRRQHMEDKEKVLQLEEEKKTLRIENDQLKFGIEQLDELAYAYDLEMANMQERIDEQEDLILEYQTELGVVQAQAAEDASHDDVIALQKEASDTHNLAVQSKSIVNLVRKSLSLKDGLKNSRAELILPNLPDLETATPPHGINKSPQSIASRLRTPDQADELFQAIRPRAVTGPTTRTCLSPAARLSRLRSGRRSALTSGRNLLGPREAFGAMSSDINERLRVFFDETEDYPTVTTYDEEEITDLCRSYRAILKKMWGSEPENSARSVRNLPKQDLKSAEEKRLLMKLAVEVMEQLGAFRQEAEELRSELRRAREEIRTKTLAAEALASELDMKTSVVDTRSILKNATVTSSDAIDGKASEKELDSVKVKDRRIAPKPMLNDLLVAQQRQLIYKARKSVRFNVLPSVFQEDEKKEGDDWRVWKPDKNVDEWTVEEVFKWLSLIDSGSYSGWAEKLKQDNVHGECLLSLTRHELKHTYKMPRDKIKTLFEELFELDPLHRMRMEARSAEMKPHRNIPSKGKPQSLHETVLDLENDYVQGDIVWLQKKSLGRGRVCYIGKTSFAAGEWVGLELIDTEGEHNGEVDGKRYFRCSTGRGLFVKPSEIEMRGIKIPDSVGKPRIEETNSTSFRNLHRGASYYHQMNVAVASQDMDHDWDLSASSDTEIGP